MHEVAAFRAPDQLANADPIAARRRIHGFVVERERVLRPTLPNVHDPTITSMVVQEVESKMKTAGKLDYHLRLSRGSIN
jgi:hypothetical protein